MSGNPVIIALTEESRPEGNELFGRSICKPTPLGQHLQRQAPKIKKHLTLHLPINYLNYCADSVSLVKYNKGWSSQLEK